MQKMLRTSLYYTNFFQGRNAQLVFRIYLARILKMFLPFLKHGNFVDFSIDYHLLAHLNISK